MEQTLKQIEEEAGHSRFRRWRNQGGRLYEALIEAGITEVREIYLRDYITISYEMWKRRQNISEDILRKDRGYLQL